MKYPTLSKSIKQRIVNSSKYPSTPDGFVVEHSDDSYSICRRDTLSDSEWIIPDLSPGQNRTGASAILHRLGGPAVIDHGNRSWKWYQFNKLHRDDGPAVMIDGTEFWYQFGKLHREDGPAIIYSNGTKIWYRYNLRHRLDGPAIECAPGDLNSSEYWVGGRKCLDILDYQKRLDLWKIRLVLES